MIRYALRCSNEHHFESWFRGSRDYDTVRGTSALECPECGVRAIEKVLMAPAVRSAETGSHQSGTQEAGAQQDPRPAAEGRPPAAPGARGTTGPPLAALAELRRRIEANAENVGGNFVTEARAIHSGESPARPIYGQARPEQARALLEEGIPVAPLPFVPRPKMN